MGFDFTETMTIQIPDVREQVGRMVEENHRGESNNALIVEISAIHEGMTANFNFYPAKALEAALPTWVQPYPKPIIMNHDPYSEPVGRVMAARMEQEADGTPYTKLQVAITDPEAIKKVLDQRYLTGSVGGSATAANCSICGVDWAEASRFNIPCKHARGKTYKGKLAYMEMNGISFKEYSFVNMPADQRSNVRSIGTATAEGAEGEDGWVRAARFFSLDMADEEIVEFSESENRNVLAGMRKKDATPVYMNLKGAFLSALAFAEFEKSDESDKESDVSDELINEEEDVLAVAEDLSSDLANSAEEEEVSEDAEEVEENEATEEEEVEAAEEEVASEEDEEVAESEEEEATDTEEAEETEEEVAEGDRPEGQEVSKTQSIDPETSAGSPVSREEDGEEAEVEEEEEEATEVQESETELSENEKALELRVEELESREQTLLEENAKLRAALKRNLAERVVDMKIALGLEEADERDALLAEHAERSASSLADSLRDLASMNPRPDYTKMPEVVDESAAVEGDGEAVVTEGEDVSEETDPEDIFVDVLMGRRSL